MFWGFVRHRLGQNSLGKVAREQLVHHEGQGKKEGTKFHIYMRNMPSWGPSAKLLLKRPCDAVIIQETHANMAESNGVL
eukprot:1585295-Pyramimonas_sp.AAC.1